MESVYKHKYMYICIRVRVRVRLRVRATHRHFSDLQQTWFYPPTYPRAHSLGAHEGRWTAGHHVRPPPQRLRERH
jgi:hypothetical protein